MTEDEDFEARTISVLIVSRMSLHKETPTMVKYAMFTVTDDDA